MKRLGLLALAFGAMHDVYHLHHSHPAHLLWACNLAPLGVGLGLILGLPRLSGAAVLWLAFGLPVWLVGLSTGGEYIPTSPLVHVGVLAVGLAGVRRLGLPAGTWWRAVLAVVALAGLCRLVTPAAENVNMAFAVWPGLEPYFPSHLGFLTLVMGAAAVFFFATERLLRRLAPPPPSA